MPKWLQKVLKSKTGWDYNGNRSSFFEKTRTEYWVEGTHYTFADGTTQYYGEKTAPVKALKRSEKMQEKVNEAILNYQNDSSNYYVRDTVEFTRDDGWNSYLALYHNC